MAHLYFLFYSIYLYIKYRSSHLLRYTYNIWTEPVTKVVLIKKACTPNTYDYIKNILKALEAKSPKYLRTLSLGPKMRRSYKKGVYIDFITEKRSVSLLIDL